MIDTLLKHKDAAKSRPILTQLNLMDGNHNTHAYGLVTLHRPSNVDRIEPLRELLTCLADLSKDLPLVMPIHPRTKANIEKFNLMHLIDRGNFLLIEPQGYLDFICLLSNAKLILSDSGGIQEEATVLGVPCLTLRENTERPITISEGTNTLVGNNPAAIVKAFNSALTKDFSEKDRNIGTAVQHRELPKYF